MKQVGSGKGDERDATRLWRWREDFLIGNEEGGGVGKR